MIRRAFIMWLTKRALRLVQNRLDEVEAALRGTATKPVYVGSLYDPNVYRVSYERVDHVHTAEGICLKNRFDKRCPTPVKREDYEPDDWGYNSIGGMG